MMVGLYVPGDSPVHRARPGLKLALLAAGGTSLFLFSGAPAAVVGLVAVLALYGLSRLGPHHLWRQFKLLAPVLLLIGVTQAFVTGWEAAIPVLVRLTALVLGAGLVTLTTRSLDMVSALEAGLQPFRRFVDPSKVALAISLALRFIPVLAALLAEIREAQRARGLERSILALAVPMILRTLKMTDEIAEAIDARN